MHKFVTWTRAIVVGALMLGYFAPSANAQCLPDGLDAGPCCLSASVTLPSFPAVAGVSTKFISFNNCNAVATANWCTAFGVPAPIGIGGALVCGAYNIPTRIKVCGLNMVFWTGTLKAHYSRNWQASSIPGAVNLTVWRFTLNGDLKPTSSLSSSPGFRPSCAAMYTTVYFSGYIDYVFDCTSGVWTVAYNLNHECDGIYHNAGTARPAPPLGFHPTRSFSFVGPGSTFVVSSLNPVISGGPITQQAMRKNSWFAAPTICNFEEPATGVFTPLNDFCTCSSSGANQYNMAAVQAVGVCSSRVNPSALGPLMQKRLGGWNNPNVYPGVSVLLFDFGFLDYLDGCSGASTSEWFEGSETIKGLPAWDFTGVALGTQFEDLGSANKSATVPATFIGAPHVVNYVLNFNMP